MKKKIALLKISIGPNRFWSIEEVQRITYEDTEASVIEFIATREAVHPMKSLDDLRSRLGPGRRVLGLFHPLLKNEPLLFVHAALTDEIPSCMDDVMDVLPSDTPKCATFYSITNAQAGLAGVGLGEYLLKQSTAVCTASHYIANFLEILPFLQLWRPTFLVAAKGVLFAGIICDTITHAAIPEVA